ncbi:MAG: helix-turn-helix transcriptional regulator [Verrucomicrobiota bacterium]
MNKTKNVDTLFKKWRKDPEYIKEHEALEEEFAIANALIKARSKANLTQAEVAARMNTTQSAVARLEGGANPSIKMLKRYAEATGTKLSIQLT